MVSVIDFGKFLAISLQIFLPVLSSLPGIPFPLRYASCDCPTVVGCFVLFLFVSGGRFLNFCLPLHFRFRSCCWRVSLAASLPERLIRGILHSLTGLLFISDSLRVSMSLFPLPICSCILSVGVLRILIILNFLCDHFQPFYFDFPS